MRTLVVDDSASMRRLLGDVLEERGHESVAVDTAERGLAAHLEHPFDIMLVDWTLPAMSGLDLCREIRSMPGGDDVIILVVTGRSRVEDLTAVLDAGASDYLAKPLDPDLLRTRLMVAESRARELTRRRQLELAMRQSENAFRSLIESSPDGVLVYRDGTIHYANPRLLAYLDYPDEDALLGTLAEDLVYAEDLPLWRERAESFTARGEAALPTELRLLRRDGAVVTAEAISMPVVYRGEPCTLKTLRDLTERKEMQAHLVMTDRMASVGTLAAGVAHELNNPLAYVVGNLELMKEALGASDPETDLLALATEAAQGAERMRHIIRDLKTFSKSDDERGAVTEVLPALKSSISICANEIRHRAHLTRELGDVPDVTVSESRLGQIFVALLMNAAQALESRGSGAEIIVRTSTDDQGWAQIEVEDNGPGIPSEVMGRIFDPFFTTKAQDVGTGLGLSICHNIVTAAKGRIQVDTQPERGTCFRVSLPAAPSGAKRPSSSHRLRATHGAFVSARVLVIDDEPLVGRSIKRALKGHQVEVVTGGAAAVALLAGEQHFDVIFCDLMMPNVSGMDVFERVSRTRPEIVSHFVFMTGGAFTARAKRFLEDTENEMLEKPFDLRLVREIVHARAVQS